MEQTLVVLKPDTVQRGIVGEIITRFERVGLKICGMKMLAPSEQHFHDHYEGIGTLKTRRGETAFKTAVSAMQDGPVVAIVLEGIDAIEHVRKMVGATDPKQAAPGTIRGDYTHISLTHAINESKTLPNIVHASADAAEAAQEIPLWFTDQELHSYEAAHARVVHGRKVE